MELGLPRASYTAALLTIDEFSLQDGFFTIFPFTTRPQKHWIEAHWIELIDQIWAQTKLPCVMLGGPGDRVASERIAQQLKHPESVINLAGERFLSIPDAAAMISSANASIGVDTGMTHMSIAHKRPTVYIFGSTIPYTETYTPKVKILVERLDCVPCRKHPSCEGRFDCMQQLSPKRVLDALLEVIDANR